MNVAEIQINPSNTCGDAGSASTGDYKVELARRYEVGAVHQGHFTPADRQRRRPARRRHHHYVRFVKYTMISTQVADLGGICPGASPAATSWIPWSSRYTGRRPEQGHPPTRWLLAIGSAGCPPRGVAGKREGDDLTCDFSSV